MEATIDYVIVHGGIIDFEEEINRLGKIGYDTIGNMNTTHVESGLEYSQLMIKITE